MKRVWLATLLFLLPLLTGAQVFNHLVIGAGVGSDGISLELASPIGSHVELHAGYGTAVGVLGFTMSGISVPEHPGYSSNNVDVPLKIRLGMSDARLLANIYPWTQSAFHITAGVYMGSPRFIRGILTNMPDDYNMVGVNVDGYLVKAHSGELEAALCAPGIGGDSFAVKPYLGIGYGRAVQDTKRITWSVDMGLQYQGKAGIWADGEGLTGRIKRVPLQLGSITDSFDKYTKFTLFWPTLNFHLYVRLF